MSRADGPELLTCRIRDVVRTKEAEMGRNQQDRVSYTENPGRMEIEGDVDAQTGGKVKAQSFWF